MEKWIDEFGGVYTADKKKCFERQMLSGIRLQRVAKR